MAVRFASMEHYRAVFAITAVMVFGLLATSPLVRTQNSAPTSSRAENMIVSSAEAAEGSTWTDPPRYTVGVPAPKPATFTLLSPEMVALLAADDLDGADTNQRVQAVRRHRAAKVATRVRPAPAAEASTALPASGASTTATQPQQAARIDPIGDLLRGLGIGRDS
ncbi:hypothetical protein [Methylorubrum extorquens]|uniref:hypothetical protein n=1 Tax=Methylorubrum extorquens TaxID=408 RepID=UPI00209E0E5A|nr:hypothetical protein [Methylorubrum extorquens]MCP1537035.1 hypothetical protein [Methylorubrum extorquens]